MPPSTRKQQAYIYAAANRGERWAKDYIAKVHAEGGSMAVRKKRRRRRR